MKQEDKEYLSQYIEVNEDVERCIKVHRQYYKNVGKVCAWYKDKEDFILIGAVLVIPAYKQTSYSVEARESLLPFLMVKVLFVLKFKD